MIYDKSTRDPKKIENKRQKNKMDPRGLVLKRSTFSAKRKKKLQKKIAKRYHNHTRVIKNKKGNIRWTHAGWCRNAQRLVPSAQKNMTKAHETQK